MHKNIIQSCHLTLSSLCLAGKVLYSSPMGAASEMATDVMSNTALLHGPMLNMHAQQERQSLISVTVH